MFTKNSTKIVRYVECRAACIHEILCPSKFCRGRTKKVKCLWGGLPCSGTPCPVSDAMLFPASRCISEPSWNGSKTENPGDGPSACEQSWSWTSTARTEFANKRRAGDAFPARNVSEAEAKNQRTQECSDKPAACSPLGREESNILWSFSESAKVTTGTVCHGSECQFGKRKLSVSPFFLNCSGDQVVLPNHKEIKPCS
ncbi:hypothetical protein PVAP13_4NG324000 [Panicum virgatum]|uniref:Uncharacterized protein n=1 Tax=Panicum virgatum TaxID=38727 RepID=A0A8T0THT7_PANVG|nr:hypothetical protein PVAP13_4NG324000 [Panicum virgatum]